jgi:hypothetical protein
MLGCGHSRGYELLRSGELESFLDGASRKIVVESIKAYIARGMAANEGKFRLPPKKAPRRTRGRQAR